jgi:voltage-gated sodium channel
MSESASVLQQRLAHLRENWLFEAFVITIIILSALVIGAKTYTIDPRIARMFRVLDFGITLFFLAEILIRMVAEGSLRRFFRGGWNVFDFVIVVASLIPVNASETAFLGRLLRIFRVLRLISIIPELRVLMNAFLTAIPRMGYVSLMMFIIFYIYGAMGSIFFEHINSALWGNISVSMLTLFRVATFEDWTDIMYETMSVFPLSWMYYLSFIFIVAFIFLNMMIGIVLETLQREHELQNGTTVGDRSGDVDWFRDHVERVERRLDRIEAAVNGDAAASRYGRRPRRRGSRGPRWRGP